MLTTVIVGNSATVRLGDRIVTRRGYPVASPLSSALPSDESESEVGFADYSDRQGRVGTRS